MSWQSVALFAILVVANLVGPMLKVDPQILGTITTCAAAFFVQRKNTDDGHKDGVDGSP